MSTKPTVSLCAIVKDQASLLRRLLGHHRPLYQEAVIVDTGSADGSADVARELGAVVGEFQWQDDFSLARNHGLEMASGQWVLVLDCDELMDPDDFPALLSLAESTPSCCHILPQQNYLPARRGHGWQATGPDQEPFALGAPGYLTSWSIRLFPNLPALRYRGAVHESLEEAAQACGLGIVRQDLSIHHQGHLSPATGQESKSEFYGRLLSRKIKSQPDDPAARYELAAHLASVGQSSLAARLLKMIVGDSPDWADRYRAELLLGKIRTHEGLPEMAARHFHEALVSRPDWQACWEAVIACQLSLDKYSVAEQYLHQARRLFPGRQVWDGYEAQVSRKGDR